MLLRQTLLYLPAQVIGPVFQFVSILVWTHFLSPASLGVFALVMAAQELAYTATLFWFSLYTMRYHDATRADADRRRFLDTELAVLAASAVASIVLVLALAGAVETAWTVPVILASLAHIVTRGVVAHLTDRARAEHDTLTYTSLQIIWPVLGLAFGALLAFVVGGSVSAILWGYTIAQALAIAVAALRLEFGRNPFALDRAMVRAAIRYGLPLLGGGVFIWLAINGLRFVVEQQSGAAAVGLITVGWMLGYRAMSFAAMLVTAGAFPLAMRRARERGIEAGQQQLERNGVLLLAALLPASAGLWLVAGPLVRLTVAEPFQAMTMNILPMSILAGAFRVYRIHFAEQIFLLSEQTVIPLGNDIFDAAASLTGAVVGLAVGGLSGSITGAAAGALASLLVTSAIAWRMHRYTVPPLDMAKLFGATVVMSAAVMSLPRLPDVASITISVAAGVLVYAAALAALYPDARRGTLEMVRDAARRLA
ncbi:MAG: oligosaccharide flippase family protein [Hyphomicrobiaceae bacterium]|nr:oligosaccharide flippase family protein [Hyphomicrobiaceae bacterium]